MMLLTKKTKAQVKEETIEVLMPSRQYSNQRGMNSEILWHCDECKILFEDKDEILVRTFGKRNRQESVHCPLIVKGFRGFFFKRPKHHICGNRLSCETREYWKDNYSIEPFTPTDI